MTEARATIDGQDYAVELVEMGEMDRIALASKAPSTLTEAAERGVRSSDQLTMQELEDLTEYFELVLTQATEFTKSEVESLTTEEVVQLGSVTLNEVFEEGEDRDEVKRVRRVRVTEEFIETLFRGEAAVVAGMPDDATFENFEYDPSRNELQFIFESSEWDEVAEGATIPVHEAMGVGIGSSTQQI